MKMLRELGRYAPNSVFISILLGALAGICYAGLIPTLMLVIDEVPGLKYQADNNAVLLGIEISNVRAGIAFLILCVAILAMTTVSQVLLTQVSVELTSEMRKRLYYGIAHCPIDALERIGSARIISVMTRDVGIIVDGVSKAPFILISLMTIIGMLFYLWVVHFQVFYFVVISLTVSIISFNVPLGFAKKYLSKVGQYMDALQESFRGIVLGAKELKLNKMKRDSFIENDLLAIEANINHVNLKAGTIATVVLSYANMLTFFVTGLLSFVFISYYQLSSQQLIGSIMIVLYLSGPVQGVLATVPGLMDANISYARMNELLAEMAVEEYSSNIEAPPEWKQMSLRGVRYSYAPQNNFQVGPIDLTIKKGEITFIVGGNGSGKSTCAKIITQHYFPNSGAVFFDEIKVDKNNINMYRQCISSVYSDYYLFTVLHGINENQFELKEKVNGYLNDFGLSEKVAFNHGEFSTLKLSDGQRRRLALIVAIIEDKDLYLFDEWAADQDPVFREIYYRKILPELKARGKAIVAISHDDRYFHVADNLIKFEAGLSKAIK